MCQHSTNHYQKVSKQGAKIMKNLLASALIAATMSTPAIACMKISTMYLDPEFILNSEARSSGVKVVDARAVKSLDFVNFYFVQYKMEVPDKGVVFPMFAMNKPFSSGLVYSMDDLAISLTGLGDGRRTKARFSKNDDGYAEASRCLN